MPSNVNNKRKTLLLIDHFDLHYFFISTPSQSELAQECHSKRVRETLELTGPSDKESSCSEKIAQK